MANAIEWLKETGEFETFTNEEIANYIVEDYVGTCKFLSDDDRDWLEETNNFGYFDSRIFECNHCGWWCGEDSYSPNEHAESVCDECSPYDDEDEED